ncbi:hypothetical protein MGH68_07120 [Erysipelothrix sp. D19-032]
MAKKNKNLNKNSKRAFLQAQLEAIQKELDEVPELTREDLLEYLESYPKSLRESEFAR